MPIDKTKQKREVKRQTKVTNKIAKSTATIPTDLEESSKRDDFQTGTNSS